MFVEPFICRAWEQDHKAVDVHMYKVPRLGNSMGMACNQSELQKKPKTRVCGTFTAGAGCIHAPWGCHSTLIVGVEGSGRGHDGPRSVDQY